MRMKQCTSYWYPQKQEGRRGGGDFLESIQNNGEEGGVREQNKNYTRGNQKLKSAWQL